MTERRGDKRQGEKTRPRLLVSLLVLLRFRMTMRLSRIIICLILLTSTLAACGTNQLLSNVGPATAELRPSGKGEHTDISYTIGQPAKIAVYLQAADGARYSLREGEKRLPSPDPYVLRFDGTAPT